MSNAPAQNPETDSLIASLDARKRARLGIENPHLSTETAVALLEVEEEETLAMGNCAGCDHAFADHLGSTGPCTIEDCACTAYEAAAPEPESDDGDAASKAVAEFYVRIRPDMSGFTEEVEAAVSEAVGGALARFDLTDFTVGRAAVAGDPVLPAEHQPAETIPERNPTPPEPEPVAAGGALDWSAILAPEGKLTSDGRAFAPGSITWRDLPLTLSAMIETSEGGHIGAKVCGRIDEIWRDEAASVIRAKGVFDDGDYGQEIARLVTDKTLRGISVDLAISKYTTGPKSDWFDEDGNWAPQEQAAEEEGPSLLDLYADDTIAVVLEAEIGMTTVCPFQAFEGAKIAVGDSLVAGANPAFWTVTQQAGWVTVRRPLGDVLTASAGEDGLVVVEEPCEDCDALTAAAAGLVPERPPADWFANPELDELTPITVTDDGRIYGHAAAWDVCHIGFPGSCRTAYHSESGYAYFHLGEVLCEGGERIACGQITLDTSHAETKNVDPGRNRADATAHYDHTGTVAAHVCCGDDVHGIWVAGALNPELSETKVRLLRGAKLSGDWRNRELIALLAVNVPGFPVPRARAVLAASAAGGMDVLSLVAAGIPVFEAELTEEEREKFAALKAHAEFAALAEQEA